MNAADFRRLALALPEAIESAHMGHPDFRVRKKIFATLGPDEDWGMIKLNLEQQKSFLREHPDAFEAIPGGWGRTGATKVWLEPARVASVRSALRDAWRNTAPKRLVAEHERE